MPKFTRIAYNSAEWQRPTGEAKKSEGGETYNRLHGFGQPAPLTPAKLINEQQLENMILASPQILSSGNGSDLMNR